MNAASTTTTHHPMLRYDNRASFSPVPVPPAPHLPPGALERHPIPVRFHTKEAGDRVVKALGWSDGGAEFVFGDGTVMSFVDDMNTFVSVNATKPHAPRDLMVTSLCVSAYEAKVRAALGLFNQFSPRPRLIHGLCGAAATGAPVEEFLWTQTAPIDSLILSPDRSLFEKIPAVQLHPQMQAQSGTESMFYWDLNCALRRVRLRVFPCRSFFSVRWPARVSETDGSKSLFVASTLPRQGQSTSCVSTTQRACRFILLEQCFLVDACPEGWRDMLQLCLNMGNASSSTEVGTARGASDSEGVSDDTLLVPGVTPSPLGAPVVPNVPLSSACGASTMLSQAHLYVPRNQFIRFSDLQAEDAHGFVASSHLQNCPAQQRLHDRSANVLWRYDADPMRRSFAPPAVYLRSGASSFTAIVSEDLAVIRGCLGSGGSASAAQVGLRVERLVGSLKVDEDHSSQLHVDVEERLYVQSLVDRQLPIPRTINTGVSVPLLGVLGESLFGGDLDSQSPPLRLQGGDGPNDGSAPPRNAVAFVSAEDCGRYLPTVADALVSLVGFRMPAQVGSNLTPTSSASEVDDSHAKGSGPYGHRVVRLTSRLDGVGSFTAMTNGVVRAVFDDRTIITLIPDAYDSDEGLVCEVRGRDASLHALRVMSCVGPSHPYRFYLDFLIPFRNFARMQSYAEEAASSVMVPTNSVPPSSAPSSTLFAGMAPFDDATSCRGTVLNTDDRHGTADSIDTILLATNGSLIQSEALRQKSVALLKLTI